MGMKLAMGPMVTTMMMKDPIINLALPAVSQL